jgi:PmbA protein
MSAEDLLGLLDGVVGRARPGEGVEVFGVDETQNEIRAYRGEVEALSSARTRGIGIRVIADHRVGYAYTADVSETALAETLDEARSNATVASPDDANVLPDPAPADPLEDLFVPAFADATIEQKVALALRLEGAVRGGGPKVKGVDSAMYGDADVIAAIASTTGVRGAYRRADCYVVAECLAEDDGATTSAYGLDVARTPDALDVEGAAGEAVRRSVRLLGGRKPATASLPIVMDPYATASFLGVLAGALTAEAVQKRRSLFADRVGDSIAAEVVTLVDDGRLAAGLAAAPWDGEGVPTGRTELIAGGTLTGFLHNSYTAAKEGVASTGNASRPGYKSPPGVSPSNLFLAPGTQDQQALLARAGTGFYCQQIMGVHSGANPISGEFSVAASGLMIRDGELAEPVREASIAATIPAMLTGLAAVADDLRFLPFGGSVGGVTVLIEGMTLGGA